MTVSYSHTSSLGVIIYDIFPLGRNMTGGNLLGNHDEDAGNGDDEDAGHCDVTGKESNWQN